MFNKRSSLEPQVIAESTAPIVRDGRARGAPPSLRPCAMPRGVDAEAVHRPPASTFYRVASSERRADMRIPPRALVSQQLVVLGLPVGSGGFSATRLPGADPYPAGSYA